MSNDIWVFSQSSGWKGYRKILRPGGASRTWRDRIGGNPPDSGAVPWIPRNTCPRSPCGKTNLCSDPANKIMFRREPMKEQPHHYVPPGTGCAPWAPPESLSFGSGHASRWKIDRNYPLDGEKSLIIQGFLSGAGRANFPRSFSNCKISAIIIFCLDTEGREEEEAVFLASHRWEVHL